MARELPYVDGYRSRLAANGYVVLREKSYRQAQERQRVAEALRRAAEEDAERARQWALNCLEVERRLSERCTFLYGAARAAGCTANDLRGHDGRVLDELDAIDQADETGTADA
ncbi:DNA binding protein [Mycobacterium phage Sejanus]|nr:DNA binding protein [Mycobacterium phage Sejanus]